MAAFKQVLAAALLVGAGSTPALAASSTSSAASDSVGTSVGSISGSIKNSSDSSSQTTVAEGEYRIIELATMPEQPDHGAHEAAGREGDSKAPTPNSSSCCRRSWSTRRGSRRAAS